MAGADLVEPYCPDPSAAELLLKDAKEVVGELRAGDRRIVSVLRTRAADHDHHGSVRDLGRQREARAKHVSGRCAHPKLSNHDGALGWAVKSGREQKSRREKHAREVA